MSHLFRYEFNSVIPMEEVEASFLLSIWAAESLHGACEVRLQAEHAIDPVVRSCVIDAATQVGRDLNRLFVGFVQREFGHDSFSVERIEGVSAARGPTTI